ncbi:MAG: hypothetical protein KY459_07810 [Acidobacteria bacterium]|nr:hypothetical protein [Acidobacteriota bacterium]
MQSKRLLEIIASFPGKRILVYGDLVADRFVYGTPKRISREAPVLILREDRIETVPGGGANAVANIASLGGVPVPVSIVGADEAGGAIVASLEAAGADCRHIARSKSSPTPTKTRILAGMPHSARQQIVRIDREERLHPDDTERRTLRRSLESEIERADACLISDYGYGVIASQDVSLLTSGGRPSTLDSRHALLEYRGVTAATPNEEEAIAASGRPELATDPEVLRTAGSELRATLEAEALLITRGSAGMALFTGAGDDPQLFPVWGTEEIVDVTGAGDTVIAAFTLALASGASFAEAAQIANYAGGIVVMKRGTAVVTTRELTAAISSDK